MYRYPVSGCATDERGPRGAAARRYTPRCRRRIPADRRDSVPRAAALLRGRVLPRGYQLIDAKLHSRFISSSARRGSMLSLRRSDDQAIQSVSQRDLASEARICKWLRYQVEHVFFARSTGSHAVEPFWFDIHMAGGAGTISPAVPIDTRHS